MTTANAQQATLKPLGNNRTLVVGTDDAWIVEDDELSKQANGNTKVQKKESFGCDTCDKSFDTKRGLGIHKGQAH